MATPIDVPPTLEANNPPQEASFDPKSHHTTLPPGFIIVRALQLFFALCLVAFSIFILVELATLGAILALVASFCAVVTLTWNLVATYNAPRAFNYWAVLAFEIFLFLFWIPTALFTIVDSFRFERYFNDRCYSSYYSGSYHRTCYETDVTERAYAVSLILVAAFTGCLLILYLVSLIIVSVFIGRHRAEGGHCHPGAVSPQDLQRHMMDEAALRRQNDALAEQYRTLQEQVSALQNQIGVAVPEPVHHTPEMAQVNRTY